jgi:hypothetical protein
VKRPIVRISMLIAAIGMMTAASLMALAASRNAHAAGDRAHRYGSFSGEIHLASVKSLYREVNLERFLLTGQPFIAPDDDDEPALLALRRTIQEYPGVETDPDGFFVGLLDWTVRKKSLVEAISRGQRPTGFDSYNSLRLTGISPRGIFSVIASALERARSRAEVDYAAQRHRIGLALALFLSGLTLLGFLVEGAVRRRYPRRGNRITRETVARIVCVGAAVGLALLAIGRVHTEYRAASRSREVASDARELSRAFQELNDNLADEQVNFSHFLLTGNARFAESDAVEFRAVGSSFDEVATFTDVIRDLDKRYPFPRFESQGQNRFGADYLRWVLEARSQLGVNGPAKPAAEGSSNDRRDHVFVYLKRPDLLDQGGFARLGGKALSSRTLEAFSFFGIASLALMFFRYRSFVNAARSPRALGGGVELADVNELGARSNKG